MGLLTRGSGQYRLVRGGLVASPRAVLVRGLNPEHHPELKAILKGAALTVIHSPGPLQEFYLRCLTQGTKPELARLTVARKIATLVWTLWKKGEVYDAERLRQSQAAQPLGMRREKAVVRPGPGSPDPESFGFEGESP